MRIIRLQYLTITLIVTLSMTKSSGQQLTNEPSTYEYGFVFNPAMTGVDNNMSFGAIYRNKWLGFEGSPQHIGAFVQYPFFDFNFSGGGYIVHDKDGPFQSSIIGLTGAYKLNELFSTSDELSLGIGTKFIIASVKPDKLIARDPAAFSDNFGLETSNTLEIDFGAFYVTDGATNFSSRYFGGIGINNMKSMFISDKSTNELYDASPHYNLVAGYEYRKFIYGYKSQGFAFFLKPILWLDYAAYTPLRILIGADVGMANLLYGGLYLSNESSIHLKLAIHIRNERIGDGGLKIELFPSYNYGRLKRHKGFSFDVGLAYVMNMD